MFVPVECCSVSGDVLILPHQKKKPEDALNHHLGEASLIFAAGWFQVVIRAGFGCVALLCFRVCYKTWQMISAASQYEIWILDSSPSWDQRDKQDLLYNDVMTANMMMTL